MTKLRPLLKLLKRLFQDPMVPGAFVCIEETLVPFRSRLKFIQYIASKRHKFGTKLLKLCLEGGYTYGFNIYCGKE
ncbi:hypothetical protein Zmor_018508 [Zophobas morio]|uniref:PiggyBac transposable element-derived protein domain-containing protein n=1 Tax=Zophobas morio TaxID=2755281 RepID=A0AA38MDL2_9CUCU|nr:hypothetical protein Zmor_018508 [Zophobas morio]